MGLLDMETTSTWQGRNVLVTGATGFVGSWLATHLIERGARVHGVVRAESMAGFNVKKLTESGVQWIRASIDDSTTLNRAVGQAGIDTVFHLAAVNVNLGAPSPIDTFTTNTAGTWAVLEACRLNPAVRRVIIASSAEVDAAVEPGATRKRHPYQVSKMAAEWVTQCYADTYGVPVAIARTDNVFGGRDFNWQRLIPGTIRSLMNGERPVLRSSGNLVRRYIYVEDIVQAYLILAGALDGEGVKGETFRVAASESGTVLKIVTRLAELTGHPELTPQVPATSVSERIVSAIPTDTMPRLPGWSPTHSLDEGLTKTVEWYKEYFRSESLG